MPKGEAEGKSGTRKIELNPGGAHEVDPSVDLDMIYPHEVRQKIVLGKKQDKKQRFQEFLEKQGKVADDSTVQKQE